MPNMPLKRLPSSSIAACSSETHYTFLSQKCSVFQHGSIHLGASLCLFILAHPSCLDRLLIQLLVTTYASTLTVYAFSSTLTAYASSFPSFICSSQSNGATPVDCQSVRWQASAGVFPNVRTLM